MPYWSANYKPFTPPDIAGLVSWYDSNSTVLSNDGLGDVLLWKDKYIYRNDLISYLGAINASNSASNLLPNSGSINASNINNDLIFSNGVMTTSRGTLEFQNRTTGATIFVCGDFDTRNNRIQNYVSLFTNNFSNPTSHNNNLTVGTITKGDIFNSNFVNVYDLSNTTNIDNTNITSLVVVGWFDPNRNISNLPGGVVGTWSNLNRAFFNQDLITGNNCNSFASNTVTVLSNNLWTGDAAREYGCNAANVLNFPFSAAYSNTANNTASTGPQLNARIFDSDTNASFIRAVAFVVNYSNAISANFPTNFGNAISATYSPWVTTGTSYRYGFAFAGTCNLNANDLMWSSNLPTEDGRYGGGLWINGSNVFNANCNTEYNIGSSYGIITTAFDLRDTFNIVFVRLGEARKTGIGISGKGGVTVGFSDKRDFYGKIGDVIVLGSNYTTNDQYRVEGYLAQKYNLLAKLRDDHPYKNGYNGLYPFSLVGSNSIITGIAFNNNTTASDFYTTGYFNGQPVSKNRHENILTTNRADFNMFVGDSCNYTAKDGYLHNIHAGLSEVLVYNNPLSEYDVGRVHKYLQEKHRSPPLYNNGSFTYL